MLIRHAMALAVAVMLYASQSALAATDADLAELRDQVRLLKEQYQQRIEALERRLAATERAAGGTSTVPATTTTAQSATVAAPPAPAPASAMTASRASGENATNPAISLVLNGVYSNLSKDAASYRIDGFVPPGSDIGPPRRGLSLAESELVMAANIDHNFRGTLIATLGANDSVGVENAFIETLALPRGFTLKAGRFFTASGYQNEIHRHAWDFADAPLANRVFLGTQRADDGIRLAWIAPTDLYFSLGGELLRGRAFPAGPAGGRDKNGAGAVNLFARLGGDIGDSIAWQAGLSHLSTSPQDRSFTDTDASGATVTNGFTGKSRLWALSGVLKWAPRGNATATSIKLQGELFGRTEDGMLTYNSGNEAAATQASTQGAYRTRQSGGYVQGIYQFMPRWRVGLRYDRLAPGTQSLGLVGNGALAAADFPMLSNYGPRRQTLMVDWSGSEFSRLRLQFARDASRLGRIDNQWLLQYIVSFGAHGAHAF